MTERLLALAALAALAAGAALHVAGIDAPAHLTWAAGTALMLVPLAWTTLRRLARGDVGVDAIALFSMGGALALGEYLAGAVVALMLAGGNALEASAGRRARRELRALVERAPRTARRRVGERLEEVPVDDVRVGDRLVVRVGEIVPVDGLLESRRAVLDEAALTGEPLPVTRGRGDPVRSGTANAGEAFELRAVRPAAESAYAGIVRLVRAAEADHAPFVRLADRYAAIFLPVTAAVAGAAWLASGDPVRALAVFVVATPCPLILAAPIALVSGVSRAARAGVVVKGATAIELLGRARTVVLDKTGTVTTGEPDLEQVHAIGATGADELLRLAASVDQLSAHPLAEALVHRARARGVETAFPDRVEERLGFGVEGWVEGRRVAVGTRHWLAERGHLDGSELPDAEPGRARVLVGVDGRVAGALVLADRPRADAAALVPALRAAGIEHVALVSGDRAAAVEEAGRALGADAAHGECSPARKVEIVRGLRERRGPVVMVGDGINDAPALALADVGIAMGTAGATVSSEAADAVIVVDRVDRVADAVAIGRRSLAVARQSVLAGIGLSVAAMLVAAAGHLPPVSGALLQEGIDVAVILNALRALR